MAAIELVAIATAVANDPAPDRALAAVDLFAAQGADTLAASVADTLFQADGNALVAAFTDNQAP